MTGMGCCGLELESLTLRQMTGLYERFRTFISLEWSIDWSSLSLNSILRALRGKDQGEERKYLLDEQEDISKAACASLKACVPAKS